MDNDAADKTVAAALRHLVHPNPETGLKGLHEIRAHTNAMLDMVEEELIRQSLSAGRTFDEIGRALGISDSKAHRKYRHLAPPGRRRRRQTRLDLDA